MIFRDTLLSILVFVNENYCLCTRFTWAPWVRKYQQLQNSTKYHFNRPGKTRIRSVKGVLALFCYILTLILSMWILIYSFDTYYVWAACVWKRTVCDQFNSLAVLAFLGAFQFRNSRKVQENIMQKKSKHCSRAKDWGRAENETTFKAVSRYLICSPGAVNVFKEFLSNFLKKVW